MDENNDNWVSFGSSVIGSDGSFSITLGTPPASLLELSDDIEAANPADTKIFSVTWFLISDGTKSFGWASYVKSAVDLIVSLNDTQTSWFYTTKNATFNDVDFWDLNGNNYTNVFSNLSVKSGWSKLYGTITKLTTTAETTTYTATAPAGLGWNFEIWGEPMPGQPLSPLQNHRNLAENFKCLKKH
ncbi:hypothetical protein IT568_13125 [bacterium]|nr:hypothetical protein [bacterium]